MLKALNALQVGKRSFLPLVEGGKGVSATNHASAGAWAKAGGLGTVSAVNADSYDENGEVIEQVYRGRRREERHEELVDYAIHGGIEQVRRAFDIAGDEIRAGRGAININILWEMGGAQRVLDAVLEGTQGLVHGVTCGAGMPYKLSEIASRHGVFYYPIVSSGRAFRALWKRSYAKTAEWLGGVVYEDPWLAGGHNGLSNAEDPRQPQQPYPRVRDLRQVMREGGIADSVPIVVAGGVWYLREWVDWIDNPELGAIAFQFGTRPLLTQESPIPDVWKRRLPLLQDDGVLLHQFSPTGFYSSAVHNSFLRELEGRTERQIPFAPQATGEQPLLLDAGAGRKNYYVSAADLDKARRWVAEGHDTAIKTPDDTLIFVGTERAKSIRLDQANCMGCLSHCAFSSWKDHGDHSTGRLADPRSFCIQKTLQDIAHGADPEFELMFAGHSATRFRTDPFYANGFIPTVQELIDRIQTGD